MGDFIKASTDPNTLLMAAAIGGGFLIGGPLGALAGAGVGGSVVSQRNAAGAEQVELDLRARDEKSAALDRSVQRKRRINAIIGAQAASAAASGLELSGSVANITIEDAKIAAEDSLVDEANTSARINALRRSRRSIGSLSRIRRATTILGGAERVAARG